MPTLINPHPKNNPIAIKLPIDTKPWIYFWGEKKIRERIDSLK